jgi:hypothetical protein
MAIAKKPSIPTSISGTNFQDPDPEPIYRIVSSVEGDWKCGKTHLGLTQPSSEKHGQEGIGLIEFDMGDEGVVQKFSVKDVKVSHYNAKIAAPDDMSGQAILDYRAECAEKVYLSFRKDWGYALNYFRSLVVDTGNELWELMRMAAFGKIEQVKPHHYAPVNAEFRDLLREAFNSKCNVMFLHSVKDQYLNDKRTGKKERAGFSGIEGVSQVNLIAYRTPVDEREDGDLGFRVEVKNCRLNPALDGEVFEPPMNEFPFIASMVFEGTGIEDWE